MESLLASIRVAAATMLVCVGFYATAVWAVAQAVVPDSAEGSLLRAEDGTVIGSSQIAQAFDEPRYVWPRPSAVDYDAAGAGGSNWSPTSPDLAARGRETVERYGATPDNPLPADLAAASGAGLDPHVSLAGALYQAPRVAEARGISVAEVEGLIRDNAVAPGGFMGSHRIVNVLELNLALDRL